MVGDPPDPTGIKGDPLTDFVWCLPPAPFWWKQAMRQVCWTLYHAATEAANLGGSLRLRPPPKTKPDPFLLRHAVVIANADPHGGQALRPMALMRHGRRGRGERG